MRLRKMRPETREKLEIVAIILTVFATIIGYGFLNMWFLTGLQKAGDQTEIEIAEKLERGEIYGIGELYAKMQDGRCLYEVEVPDKTGLLAYIVYCIVDVDDCPERLLITKPIACSPDYSDLAEEGDSDDGVQA